jgi:hypothetical protein
LPDGGLETLDVPDAEIGDSGATLPECYSCIESTCPRELAVCNIDCSCTMGVVGFVQCLYSGRSTIECGTQLAGSGDPNTSTLTQCVGGQLAGGSGPGCLEQCGVSLGVDAGAGD